MDKFTLFTKRATSMNKFTLFTGISIVDLGKERRLQDPTQGFGDWQAMRDRGQLTTSQQNVDIKHQGQ
jgi:hypothetical protein